MSEYPQYRFYVGEKVGNVSLWRRTDEDTERPIVANTRGLTTWFSYEFDEYANTEPNEPTDAFWESLAEIADGAFEVDISDCEWYERELLNSLGQPQMTEEQRQLIDHAIEIVDDD